jgi:hypothetical protein
MILKLKIIAETVLTTGLPWKSESRHVEAA